jgi:hypothetical protein
VSLVRSYTCDGCGRGMRGGDPRLSLHAEETEVEREAGRRKRRARSYATARVGFRSVQMDLCGDCARRPLNVGAALDRLIPPMKECAACGGVGDRALDPDADAANWEECSVCNGSGEVPA